MNAILACTDCVDMVRVTEIPHWTVTYITVKEGAKVMVCPHIPDDCNFWIPRRTG